MLTSNTRGARCSLQLCRYPSQLSYSAGSAGYDTLFLLNREGYGPYNWCQAPIATLASRFTGIRIDVYTDQDAFQLCSWNGQNGASCNHCAAVLQQMANHRYS